MEDTSPATKADMSDFRSEIKIAIADLSNRMDERFERAREENDSVLQVTIAGLSNRMDERFERAREESSRRLQTEIKAALEPYATKQEMRAGFAYLNENIDRVLNVVMHMNDRLTPLVEDHERRLKRLEKETGLAAAV